MKSLKLFFCLVFLVVVIQCLVNGDYYPGLYVEHPRPLSLPNDRAAQYDARPGLTYYDSAYPNYYPYYQNRVPAPVPVQHVHEHPKVVVAQNPNPNPYHPPGQRPLPFLGRHIPVFLPKNFRDLLIIKSNTTTNSTTGNQTRP